MTIKILYRNIYCGNLELSSLTELDHMIAITLIDSFDDSGYLQESVENIYENLNAMIMKK